MAKGRSASRLARRQLENIAEQAQRADVASFRKLVNKTKDSFGEGKAVIKNMSDVTSTTPDIVKRGRPRGLSMTERYSNVKNYVPRAVESVSETVETITDAGEAVTSSLRDSIRAVKNNKGSITPEKVKTKITPVTNRSGAVPSAVRTESRIEGKNNINTIQKNTKYQRNKGYSLNPVSEKRDLIKTIASSTPMKAIAGASVSTLIMGNMVRSKGQQSNAELYGQRTPYM